MLKGVDVSHYQRPSAVPYEALAAAGYSFVYINATDGIRPDPQVDEHTKRARGAGLEVGFYCFWMQQQDPEAQARAFRDTIEPLGFGPGWLLPALDLEWQPGKLAAQRDLFDRARRTSEMFCEWWSDHFVYTAASFWISMGRPGWWLDHPLWIAHYGVGERDVKSLSDKRWTIWQHAAAPIDGLYAADIDQNRARELLYVSKPAPTFEGVSEQFLSLAPSLADQRADRDAYIRDTEDDR